MGYLGSHWHGRQGLAWSFWVNLVSIRVGLLLLQDRLPTSIETGAVPQALAVIGFAILAHGIVFAWQLIGVVRACDRHVAGYGSMANVWGAQLGAVLMALLTAAHLLGAWQAAFPAPDERAAAHQRMRAERASRYRLERVAQEDAVRLSGTIELGITDALRDHLVRHPGTRTVVLDSPGGNVFEARGLARTIRDHALDTRVTDRCSSACTIAFIGGHRRSLARGARLGFHRYRIDASYPALGSDPEAAQRRDRELYGSAGIAADFLERMFDADATGLWVPSPAQLREAGVVTDIVD